jgi:hypothetical protein
MILRSKILKIINTPFYFLEQSLDCQLFWNGVSIILNDSFLLYFKIIYNIQVYDSNSKLDLISAKVGVCVKKNENLWSNSEFLNIYPIKK